MSTLLTTDNTIFKYPLVITDRQFVMLPFVRSLLTVQVQDSIPCLWAWVNTSADKTPVEIACFGTGHPGPLKDHKYLSTIQLHGCVWHFFYREIER